MSRYITSDKPEEMREELNRILKRLWQDVDEVAGRAGQFRIESQRNHQSDVVFENAYKGPVLKADVSPDKYYRLWVDGDGALSTEAADPGIKE